MEENLELDFQKLEAGDEETLQLLADHVILYLQRILARYSYQLDVTDVVQDVLITLFRDPKKLASLGTIEKIRRYCSLIARNTVVHYTHRTGQSHLIERAP